MLKYWYIAQDFAPITPHTETGTLLYIPTTLDALEVLSPAWDPHYEDPPSSEGGDAKWDSFLHNDDMWTIDLVPLLPKSPLPPIPTTRPSSSP
ncbi:hypothetical protein E1B28_008441 [Marasmius oreades]|uniref:Uncharacterized protein n=1 Tax=Marasmius oreades TaxID=181124 RepID=A0A9P7USE1_9AGAR|nr:uncharacterized protein E1B28_008441 [Marasmius oreades]KAG7092060.1 hypothetical protein E1B28_008441 [Marasmius oreades]